MEIRDGVEFNKGKMILPFSGQRTRDANRGTTTSPPQRDSDDSDEQRHIDWASRFWAETLLDCAASGQFSGLLDAIHSRTGFGFYSGLHDLLRLWVFRTGFDRNR
uniref:Uncharacterized protein n=1 Tax=Solanum tuberosum TaxID=4113 RepID=M1DYH2_SOLTU